MNFLRVRRERGVLVLLAAAVHVAGQTPRDPHLSLYGYSEDAKVIRFTIQNNHTAPITFYQVRLQATCADGAVVEAGGWSFDTTWTRAARPDLGEFAPIKTEPIDPGNSHQFEFLRPFEIASRVVGGIGKAGETVTCQQSTLKDFTAIFADGNVSGARDLIDKQFMTWQAQQVELKHWLGPLHDLRASQDASAGIKDLRDSLNREYDNCEDRPLAVEELTKCQVNREVWHHVNTLWQRLSSRPQVDGDAVVRLIDYWDRVAVLLQQQLSSRN